MGRLPEARSLFQSIPSTHPPGDDTDTARALNGLGLIDWQEGRIAEARQRFEACRQMCSRIGLRTLLAKTVGNLGILHLQEGRIREAASCYAEARQILEQLGDVVGVVIAYNNLGTLWLQAGDFRQALGCFETMAGLVRGFDNDRWLSVAFSRHLRFPARPGGEREIGRIRGEGVRHGRAGRPLPGAGGEPSGSRRVRAVTREPGKGQGVLRAMSAAGGAIPGIPRIWSGPAGGTSGPFGSSRDPGPVREVTDEKSQCTQGERPRAVRDGGPGHGFPGPGQRAV